MPNTNNTSHSLNRVKPFPLKLIAIGATVSLFFFFCLSVWTSLVPIEGAVVSPGIVDVSSHHKIVQHLEGGIIENIFVYDGYHVSKGELLVQLRSVHQVSLLKQLERKHTEALAVLSRLIAEANSETEIIFPEELTKHKNRPDISSVIQSQINILASIHALNRNKRSVIQKQITQVKEEIAGIVDQQKAQRRQYNYINKELVQTEKAIERQLLPKTKAFSLYERLASIEEKLSINRSKKSKLEQSIEELYLQISEARAQYLAGVNEHLGEQRALVFDLSQRIISTKDILDRTRIVSPIDGIVVNLQIHTLDGVVEAGKPILEIVPTNDDLVVHAFIRPEDIDEVRPGMPADIRLTSTSKRQRSSFAGVVSNISADRLYNSQTGKDYYNARIDLTTTKNKISETALIPGMGADVFIRTGARTPLEYILSPITKSLRLGLREQ